MRKEELTHDVITGYLDEFVRRRHSFDDLFEETQKRLSDLSPRQLDLIQSYHLWEGYRAGHWYDRLVRFVGVGSLDMIQSMIFALPSKGYKQFLVIPYYDVPGRIASLLFLGKNGKSLRVHASPSSGVQDDGLMMLDLLDTNNDTVVAVRDPMFAIHLQRRAYNISEQPLKVVAYGAKTTRAWQTVHARRLIFWEREDDLGLYVQSMLHPRAYVSVKPGFLDTDMNERMRGMSVAEIMNRIEQSAKPWGEAMKLFLLNSEYWQVTEALKELELSAVDIQRVYDACSPSEKARVQQLFGEASVGNYITVGNLRVVESDDGWWIMRGADRELGCNAIVRLESLVHVIDTGENIYEGEVLFRQERIKFRVPVEIVEKNAAKWLRELMMKHVGVLKLSKAIQSHIIEIAKQFHDPQYVKRIGRIGWNASAGAFVFPNFSIKNGAFDDSMHAMVLDSAEGVPAAKLYISEPREGDWDLMRDNTPAHATVWAGLAGFMSNMLSSLMGSEPTPLAFVGGYGSIASTVGEHLVEELGIPKVKPSKPYNPLHDIPELNRRHDFPVWLNLSEKNRKSIHHVKARDGGNLMTHLFEIEAASAAVGESWTFINSPEIMQQKYRLPSLRGALAYLVWLQAKKFELPPASSLPQSTLLSLEEWAIEMLGAVKTDVIREASKMLRTPDSESVDRRLMWLIFNMANNQRLKMAHILFYDDFCNGSSPSLKAHLIIDDDKKKIFVNLGVLRNAIDRAKLPIPDYDTAIRAFAATHTKTGFEAGVDGFVINQTYWDSEASRWRKQR